MQTKLCLSYDLGKGYVTCQEEVHNAIDDLIDAPNLASKVKGLLNSAKARMMSELCETSVFFCNVISIDMQSL